LSVSYFAARHEISEKRRDGPGTDFALDPVANPAEPGFRYLGGLI
jgi:hypothetical protein